MRTFFLLPPPAIPHAPLEIVNSIYMVAAGIPAYRPDHADAISRLALRMVAAAGAFAVNDTPLVAKAGIHVGNCIAGIIGQSLPRYRLFGDLGELLPSFRLPALCLALSRYFAAALDHGIPTLFPPPCSFSPLIT